jgi:hypothetical protein
VWVSLFGYLILRLTLTTSFEHTDSIFSVILHSAPFLWLARSWSLRSTSYFRDKLQAKVLALGPNGAHMWSFQPTFPKCWPSLSGRQKMHTYIVPVGLYHRTECRNNVTTLRDGGRMIKLFFSKSVQQLNIWRTVDTLKCAKQTAWRQELHPAPASYFGSSGLTFPPLGPPISAQVFCRFPKSL